MKLWSFRKPVTRRIAPSVPAGCRVYAIGDVHGRLDLLIELIDLIRRDHQERAAASATVVMLGDLIDRGPQSAEVIDFLLGQRPDFATFCFLMGNHEEAMLNSLEPGIDPRNTGWLTFGGLETLASYGVPASLLLMEGKLLAEELRRYFPESHLAFIESFEDRFVVGDYLFVHAGIRPGVPLDQQKPEDLRWIRGEFLEDKRRHEHMVVHGHTIAEQPQIRPNRIGIDTGAYRTGVLTALALEGSERWLLATQPREADSGAKQAAS